MNKASTTTPAPALPIRTAPVAPSAPALSARGQWMPGTAKRSHTTSAPTGIVLAARTARGYLINR